MKLTSKQRAVLDFVRGHVLAHGYPPTVREITFNFGYASQNSAQCHINILKRKGCITNERGLTRTIALTELGRSQ